MTLALRDYQIEDLAFYISQDKWMNLSDPGTGKTPSVCVWTEYLWKHQGCKTLWTMPKSLLKKNKMELHNFTEFKDNEVVIIDGTPKQRQKQIESPNTKVFLMGFTRYGADWENIKKVHPDVNATLVDEIHMGFKSHNSKRTESFLKSMKKIKYFGAMSGTLIDGRLDSCYPTIKAIEPRYYACHWSFLSQHGIFDDYGTVVAWQNHAKLGRIFLKHGIRRKFEDVYGKQEYVVHHEWCEMHPKQIEAYEEFETFAMLEIDKYLKDVHQGIISGDNPGVKTIRCRQIMSHPETFGILGQKELTGKDEQLLIHIEDHKNNGQPLLVFSVFKHEQERLKALFEKHDMKVGLINGSVSSQKRNDIDEKFRSGDIQVVVASPETTAVGYNWGHVDHIIFVTTDYKNTNFTQGVRRAIRGVRNKTLRVTILAYDNEVEKSVFEVLNKKSRDLNKVDNSYEILNLGKNNY